MHFRTTHMFYATHLNILNKRLEDYSVFWLRVRDRYILSVSVEYNSTYSLFCNRIRAYSNVFMVVPSHVIKSERIVLRSRKNNKEEVEELKNNCLYKFHKFNQFYFQ